MPVVDGAQREGGGGHEEMGWSGMGDGRGMDGLDKPDG